jgi:hypothetical protein
MMLLDLITVMAPHPMVLHLLIPLLPLGIFRSSKIPSIVTKGNIGQTEGIF